MSNEPMMMQNVGVTTEQSERAFKAGIVVGQSGKPVIVHADPVMIELAIEVDLQPKAVEFLTDCFRVGARAVHDEKTMKMCSGLFNYTPEEYEMLFNKDIELPVGKIYEPLQGKPYEY